MAKERLDKIVMAKACVSRTIAQDLIERGLVSLEGEVLTAPGKKWDDDGDYIIQMPDRQYVGRAGYKLEKALAVFPMAVSGCICLDVGASTGGFTDCLLQHGAAKVYAVDTGTDQLHPKLRQDSRVILMEQTNINDVKPFGTGEKDQIEIAVVDVSFVSLTKILANVGELLNNRNNTGSVCCLVKPQFEVGRAGLNNKGIVKNAKDRRRALTDVYGYATEIGFAVCGCIQSPILGGDGNREYLLYLKKGEECGHIKQKEFQRLAGELAESPL